MLHGSLSVAGLGDAAYWLSWAATHWSTLLVSGLLCTAMCAYPFPHTSLWLLAGFFALLAAALVPFRSGACALLWHRYLGNSAQPCPCCTVTSCLCFHGLSLTGVDCPTCCLTASQLPAFNGVPNCTCRRHSCTAAVRTGRPPRLHQPHCCTLWRGLLVVGLPAAALGGLHVCWLAHQLGAGQQGPEHRHLCTAGASKHAAVHTHTHMLPHICLYLDKSVTRAGVAAAPRSSRNSVTTPCYLVCV